VRRFVLAIVVGLLSVSASGISHLLVDEPCTGYELAGETDGGCPPTCVTCGCCAQAAEPAAVVVATSPQVPATTVESVTPPSPKIDPRPILHVPKFRFA
jgi:hypothetical protein